MKRNIDELIAGIAPDPGPGLTGGARELLGEITALPVPVPGFGLDLGRRRLRVAVPLVAALVMAVVALSWVVPGTGTRQASAALDIRQVGGYYIVTVRDLFADPKLYQAELLSKGLDIKLRVVPASPSTVGTIAAFDKREYGLSDEQVARRPDLISAIQAPGSCAFGDGGCTIGLRIPVHFTGQAAITLGRKGRPGERYADFGQLDAPGEPLQCTPFVNESVDKVRAMLRAHGVTIMGIDVPNKGSFPSVPGSWHVQQGWLSELGKAVLVAAPTPNPTTYPQAEAGCPHHS